MQLRIAFQSIGSAVVKGFDSTVAIAGIVTSLCGCAHQDALVRIEPDRYQVMLHVGELAVIEVRSDAQYSLSGPGNALILQTRQERNGVTSYVYRAVRAGNDTIVATPAKPGADGCISCVTVHYFVKVE